MKFLLGTWLRRSYREGRSARWDEALLDQLDKELDLAIKHPDKNLRAEIELLDDMDGDVA